jgi:hypothetical protein
MKTTQFVDAQNVSCLLHDHLERGTQALATRIATVATRTQPKHTCSNPSPTNQIPAHQSFTTITKRVRVSHTLAVLPKRNHGQDGPSALSHHRITPARSSKVLRVELLASHYQAPALSYLAWACPFLCANFTCVGLNYGRGRSGRPGMGFWVCFVTSIDVVHVGRKIFSRSESEQTPHTQRAVPSNHALVPFDPSIDKLPHTSGSILLVRWAWLSHIYNVHFCGQGWERKREGSFSTDRAPASCHPSPCKSHSCKFS